MKKPVIKTKKRIKKHHTEKIPEYIPTKFPEHIPIGVIEPEHVAAIKEPLVVAAVPKSTWEKFLDWIG
jgi:hypothetical protein